MTSLLAVMIPRITAESAHQSLLSDVDLSASDLAQ